MSTRVCIVADSLAYPQGGGHAWVYLNWALGLRAAGANVTWLEVIGRRADENTIAPNLAALRERLRPFGLAENIAVFAPHRNPRPAALADCPDLDAAVDADLLLSLFYGLHEDVVRRFRRSAVIDIDPGLLQMWIHDGDFRLPKYDIYFTIGETVGAADTRIPNVGIDWHYTPPCVATQHWPVVAATRDAPFTTVSHWHADEWIKVGDEYFLNDKYTGFAPFLELPRITRQPLELALCLCNDDFDHRELTSRGWRVREAWEVSGTPAAYQQYIQSSRGEFSCVKPSCVIFQNAWISDRTICYLASGKPAIVQHTGPSRFLPDAEGLWRFRDLADAARCLDSVQADYERQCKFARSLAEEFFDAAKIAHRVLERALN